MLILVSAAHHACCVQRHNQSNEKSFSFACLYLCSELLFFSVAFDVESLFFIQLSFSICISESGFK